MGGARRARRGAAGRAGAAMMDEKPMVTGLTFGAREAPFDQPYPATLVKRDAAQEAHFSFRHSGGRLEEWRAKVRALGVAPGMFPEDIETTISKALGVRPDASNEKDLKASEAWALVSFADNDAELWRMKHAHVAPADRESVTTFMETLTARLGEIMEWWRFRGGGHDEGAMRERAAMVKRREGGAKNASSAADKRARARQLAGEINAPLTKSLSKLELARRVKAQWGAEAPSIPTIGRYLREKNS